MLKQMDSYIVYWNKHCWKLNMEIRRIVVNGELLYKFPPRMTNLNLKVWQKLIRFFCKLNNHFFVRISVCCCRYITNKKTAAITRCGRGQVVSLLMTLSNWIVYVQTYLLHSTKVFVTFSFNIEISPSKR